MTHTVARGPILTILLLLSTLVVALPSTSVSAATITSVTRPITTDTLFNLLSGTPGTQWGQSYVHYTRAAPFVGGQIYLRGVTPSHTYTFVFFALAGDASTSVTTASFSNGFGTFIGPPPVVKTDSHGNGFARFQMLWPGSGGFAMLVDGPASSTVIGVTPFTWSV